MRAIDEGLSDLRFDAIAAQVQVDFGSDRQVVWKRIFILQASSVSALAKQADHPAASSCSGLVPGPAPPGIESLTSRRPSLERAAPFSRPPVV
jgi:hypothetical protein